VNDGVFDKKGLYRRMCDEPAKYPGASGCRNIRDVESDLKAQIAANHKGIQLIHAILEEYGLETVQEYMYYIRANAENSVRNLLREVSKRQGMNVLSAIDYLDDGSPITLKVTIDPSEGSAVLDFTGTGSEVRGNLNAPISVVHSAVIYCMRAMLDLDIPLNAGCLVPLKVIIPPKSLLSPSRTAAVCGGNVLTSQRIVDVVLRAFDACAASQGCTNNLTFGAGGKNKDGTNVAGWGYYETIAGGSGAGPGFAGTSGVHTHITNTRIGDIEILERRYPVLIREFGLRDDSKGTGEWDGGEGVRRVLEVRGVKGMQVSIMSERRTRQPYGLHGGNPGGMGRNTWIKRCRQEDGDLPSLDTNLSPDSDSSSDSDSPKTPDPSNESPANAGTGSPDDTSTQIKMTDPTDPTLLVPAPLTREINIGGKATVWMGEGDRLVIETPGGGAWGAPSSESQAKKVGDDKKKPEWEPRGSFTERAAKQAGF
jgi:5-oxoprolinase (ATP-hydrolysing)